MAQRLPLRSAALCLAGVAVAFALFHHSADSDSSARASSSPLSALLSLGVKLVLTSVLVLLAQLALALWIERPRLSRDRGPDRARRGPCGGPTSLPARSRVAAVRPLYFTSPAAWSVTQTRARWEAAAAAKGEEASSSSSSSEASAPRFLDAALDSVLKLVVRDFVLKWYSPLSDSPTFPNAVETIIRDALVAVSVRVARVDWSEILVGRILPLLTLHLEQCHVAEQAVHGKRRDDAGSSSAPLPPPDSDEADLFLAARFAQETQSKRLHPAVDTASTNSRPAEDAWLRQVVESILPHILPEHEYESEAVRIMVREIVACAVMIPILETLCDPDFWNRLIDDKAGAAIQDQRMVSQFRQALDRQGAALVSTASRSFTAPAKLPSTSSTSTSKRSADEIINVRTSARQFDAWLKGISRCSTLANAKRLRSDVTAQIRRAKTVTDGRQLEESVEGVTVAQWIDYIERLYVAKRKIDKQITKLGGETSGLTRAPSVYHIAQSGSSGLSFRDILLEPNAVIYAMEYLERRRHAGRAQFWLLVEGLKDPLEDLLDVDGEEQQLVVVTEEEIRRAYLDDIRMVWDVYLAQDQFRTRPALLETVKSFALRPTTQVTTPTELRTLRHALFAIQQGVLALLDEQDMPGFVKSDLYFKAASTIAAAAVQAEAQAPPPPPNIPAENALTPPPPTSRPLPTVTPPTPVEFRTLSKTSEPESPTSPAGGGGAMPDRSRESPTPLLATLMTRTRSNSPSRPPSPSPKTVFPPPPPPPSTAQIADLVAARTNTAPPQVSFHTVFDHPHSRSQSRSKVDIADSSPSPTLSPRDGAPRTVAASDTSPASRKTPPTNNSLEFLISPVKDPVDRSPLFVGDLSESVDDQLERAAEDEDDDFVQIQTIDAIQDALSSILATSDAKATPQRLDSSISSLTSLRDDVSLSKQESKGDMRRRSASSLASTEAAISTSSIPPSPGKGKPPPLPARRNRPVFDDPETYEDADPEWQPPESVTVSPQPLRAAFPLSRSEILEETARLAEQLDKLQNQESLVEALIRKAELTGNAVELKVLVKSRESLAREVRATMYQRDQLAAQAAEDEISSKRTRITIPGTSIGQVHNLGTQTFQLYLVEVRQLEDAGTTKAAWIVTKRYSEFAALHDRLRDRYTPARSLDFPSKRLVGAWSKEFIEQRRLGLERYLQSLLRFEEICTGDELRAFLSKESIALPKNEARRTRSAIPAGPGFVRNLYRGLTSGIDDVLGTSTTSMLDAVVDRLSAQATDFAGQASAGLRAEDLVGQLSSAVATTPGMATSREEGLTSFTAPICDLFITLFDLKDKNNWLRRQAILIVLQQVLGGTIERKVRDTVTMLLSPPQLAGYLNALRGTMWPAGQLRPPGEPRTAAQKIATREAALLKLSALMPDVAANLIGRHNAKYGARRVFAALQSKRLNKHLAYSILEDLVDAIFPERTTAKARPLFPT